MANKFVWSGAGGSNDGSSWDNAYTSLMRDWGAEAGFTPATDYIYVRSVHSESSGAALTISGSTTGTVSPCRIVCVVGDTTGTTPGNLATGASVTTTAVFDIRIKKGLYIYGLAFYSSDNISFEYDTRQDVTLEQCTLKLTGSSATDNIQLGGSGDGSLVRWLSVTLDFNNAGHGIALAADSSVLRWTGGAVVYDVNYLFSSSYGTARNILSGVDLSVLTSSSIVSGNSVGSPTTLIFARCLLASGMTIVSSTISVAGFRVESYHCQIGTDADPSYQMEIQDSRGKVSANTAKYRTGGASDGVRSTPICWDVDTTVGSVRGYPGHAFECPPITAWTTGDGSTAHTYRIAFASDATINDDEIWMELEGPNDAATNSLAALKTTRVAPQTSAAAYTTDGTSTWTGTGVGTKQYMQVTYTPDKPGPVTVRVMMAKASDNIYVDPKIQIDPA